MLRALTVLINSLTWLLCSSVLFPLATSALYDPLQSLLHVQTITYTGLSTISLLSQLLFPERLESRHVVSQFLLALNQLELLGCFRRPKRVLLLLRQLVLHLHALGRRVWINTCSNSPENWIIHVHHQRRCLMVGVHKHKKF